MSSQRKGECEGTTSMTRIDDRREELRHVVLIVALTVSTVVICTVSQLIR